MSFYKWITAPFIIIISVCLLEAAGTDASILLRSIAEVESNNQIARIGVAGERSQYQFMEETWNQYSKIPFNLINLPKYQLEVKRVAKKHIETIKIILSQRGLEITPYNIALAWNGGPDKLIYSTKNKEYAKRVANLYWLYL